MKWLLVVALLCAIVVVMGEDELEDDVDISKPFQQAQLDQVKADIFSIQKRVRDSFTRFKAVEEAHRKEMAETHALLVNSQAVMHDKTIQVLEGIVAMTSPPPANPFAILSGHCKTSGRDPRLATLAVRLKEMEMTQVWLDAFIHKFGPNVTHIPTDQVPVGAHDPEVGRYYIVKLGDLVADTIQLTLEMIYS